MVFGLRHLSRGHSCLTRPTLRLNTAHCRVIMLANSYVSLEECLSVLKDESPARVEVRPVDASEFVQSQRLTRQQHVRHAMYVLCAMTWLYVNAVHLCTSMLCSTGHQSSKRICPGLQRLLC